MEAFKAQPLVRLHARQEQHTLVFLIFYACFLIICCLTFRKKKKTKRTIFVSNSALH